MGYRGDDWIPFLKITVKESRDVPKVRGVFERGECDFQGLWNGPVSTFESNIVYTLRFMIDTKVSSDCGYLSFALIIFRLSA